MKAIKVNPNKALMQVMAEAGEEVRSRSNVWVVCRKRGEEIGDIVRTPYKSLKRATTAWRKRTERDGNDSGWVVITSDQLASCGMIWL